MVSYSEIYALTFSLGILAIIFTLAYSLVSEEEELEEAEL